MPDLKITDEDRLKFKQLLREAASDGTIIGNFIQSLFQSDTTNQGGNADNKLSENEIESWFERLISKSIDKYYQDNQSVESDPWTSGASFKGIKKGNQYLSTSKIEKDIDNLEETKSDIGHHHIPSDIDSKDSSGNTVDPLSVDIIPDLNASKITDGVINRPVQTTGRIQRQDASDSDITSLQAGQSGTNNYYWNNVTSDHDLKYELLDSQGHIAGALVTNINTDGSVISHLRAYNRAGKGEEVYNDISTGLRKTVDGSSIKLEKFYSVTDINAFYRGIKPLPSHMGILYGVQTGISVNGKENNSQHTVTFDPSSSQNNNVSTFKFAENPIVILTVKSDAANSQFIHVSVVSTSKTQFVYRVYGDPYLISLLKDVKYSNDSQSFSASLDVNWIAIGACSF